MTYKKEFSDLLSKLRAEGIAKQDITTYFFTKAVSGNFILITENPAVLLALKKIDRFEYEKIINA